MENQRHILYVEDDLDLAILIVKMLEKKGFKVSLKNNLSSIVEEIQSIRPDLLLLDIEVGNQSSLEELPFLRNKYPLIPIIFTSSHTDIETVDLSYDNGINLFIKKPFSIKELLHNINLLLNSTSLLKKSVLSFGKFTFDTECNQLFIDEQSIAILSPKESLLLQILLSHQGKVVSRSLIMQQIWNNTISDDSLNNCINHLRSFLNKDSKVQIFTLRGQGYRLTIT
ncbi:response regulator transcription factor [Parabacteroides sp. AF14-59]|uniref:response regulator transcription factor n=1 Tax=Parabacteroides sp. AF14-59 TaxID=2292240 RepID=UPI000F00DF50|nr:response regulator transcription factor [Parabacteroides sp. AF14-59]RHR93632.1 DNA-binding response regulator [Parabacteroides sp. AF14-59]